MNTASKNAVDENQGPGLVPRNGKSFSYAHPCVQCSEGGNLGQIQVSPAKPQTRGCTERMHFPALLSTGTQGCTVHAWLLVEAHQTQHHCKPGISSPANRLEKGHWAIVGQMGGRWKTFETCCDISRLQCVSLQPMSAIVPSAPNVAIGPQFAKFATDADGISPSTIWALC